MAQVKIWDRGRRSGFSDDGRYISLKGFASGEHESQFNLNDPSRVTLFDDFLGDLIADEWNVQIGSDASPSAGAISVAQNGLVLLTSGDSAGTVAADYTILNSALQWKAGAGDLAFQARVKLAAITSVSCFIGFTDNLGEEQPIYSAGSADTFTSDATDAVGFMFDTAMTTVKWWATGVKNDVDATHVTIKDTDGVTTIAPVADTYATFRIVLNTSGDATFFYNGAVCAVLANAVTPTIALTPHFGIRPKSAVAGKTMSIDYAYVSALRV